MSVSARRARQGFTLIEIAVVIMIMALLLTGILVPVVTQIEQRRIAETDRILEQAREALIGYVIANDRFPCPADATSNGQEAGANPLTGACTTFHGFFPAVTVGLSGTDSQGYLMDAWAGSAANRIRYSVSNGTVNAIANVFTTSGGLRAATMPGLSSAATTNYLHVCASSSGVVAGNNCGAATNRLTDRTPAVLYSSGPNAATTGGAGADETENPNNAGGSADRVFVSHVRADGVATGGEFDDQLTWVSLNTLFARLVAAGRLP